MTADTGFSDGDGKDPRRGYGSSGRRAGGKRVPIGGEAQADVQGRKGRWRAESVQDCILTQGTISVRISQRGQFFPQLLRGQLEELPEAQLGQFQTLLQGYR